MPLVIDLSGPSLVLQPVAHLNSSNACEVEEGFMEQMEMGQRQMVLDLGKLSYVSSAGLRVILLMAKRLKDAGGELVLCEIQPQVREVLSVSGFLAILSVHESRSEACQHLQARRAALSD